MRNTLHGQLDIQQHLDLVAERFVRGYHTIGQSARRPYLHFVYDPAAERQVLELLPHFLQETPPFEVHQVDLLSIAVESLRGQEERRQQLLSDPRIRASQARSWFSLKQPRCIRLAIHPASWKHWMS